MLACPRGHDGRFYARELAAEQTLENLDAFSARLDRMHDILVKNGRCRCLPVEQINMSSKYSWHEIYHRRIARGDYVRIAGGYHKHMHEGLVDGSDAHSIHFNGAPPDEWWSRSEFLWELRTKALT